MMSDVAQIGGGKMRSDGVLAVGARGGFDGWGAVATQGFDGRVATQGLEGAVATQGFDGRVATQGLEGAVATQEG